MGAVRDFILHHYRHFNAAVVVDAAQGLRRPPRQGRQDARHAGRRHEHGRAGPLAGEMIRQDKVHAHLLHRRQPRGGRLQPGRARPLRARAQLPRPLARGREGAARAAASTASPTPASPRRRRCARIERDDARALAEGATRAASATSPTSTSTSCSAAAKLEELLPDRPQGLAGSSPRPRRTCRSSCPAGRTPPSATSSWPRVIRGDDRELPASSRPASSTWATLVELVQRDRRAAHVDRLLPDRRRHRRRLPDLRRADDPAGPAAQDVPHSGATSARSRDSTTSYGSYSGAVPNEKITWGKLDVDTPRFVIESDATIVFPLVAAYLLDM